MCDASRATKPRPAGRARARVLWRGGAAQTDRGRPVPVVRACSSEPARACASDDGRRRGPTAPSCPLGAGAEPGARPTPAHCALEHADEGDRDKLMPR